MSIRIIKSGLLDTIQDIGRYGYQHSGVNPGGVMDPVALRVANALLGNEDEEPVLEMHFPAATIFFESAAMIAITGADFGAVVEGAPVSLLQPLWVNKNTTLHFSKQVSGARVYLAVKGGFKTSRWLGSNSTHLAVQAGGFEGRALQKNDRLFFRSEQYISGSIAPFEKLPWKADIAGLYNTAAIRFIAGAEYYELEDGSKQKLENIHFRIGAQSDRMGYRLHGTTLGLHTPHEMISSAVTKGTIQLLPDGQLIILMADHQTTGGYPRIGHLVSADMPVMAQMQVSQTFTLERTDLATAEELLLAQQRNLQQLRNACIFRLQQYFTK